MAFADLLLPEIEQEAAATRAVLERVPEDKFDWKPHDKSFSLGRLASHTAEIMGWVGNALEKDELDFAPPGEEPQDPWVASSRAELIETLDRNAASATEVVGKTDDAEYGKPWTLKSGGEALFTMPKGMTLRRFVLSHLVHHRAQLGVYLRLLDIPVPSTFGPSADEQSF